MRTLAAAAAMLGLAACSSSTQATRHPTIVVTHATCSQRAPIADTLIGAGLAGAGTAGTLLASFEDDSMGLLVGSAAVLLVGAVFLVSSHQGFAQHEACTEEIV